MVSYLALSLTAEIICLEQLYVLPASSSIEIVSYLALSLSAEIIPLLEREPGRGDELPSCRPAACEGQSWTKPGDASLFIAGEVGSCQLFR